MSDFKDLIGQVFDRLTVIKRVENDKYKNAQFLCKCICGNEIIVNINKLKSSNTRSCGCLFKETMREKIILPEGEASFHQLCYSYKQGAKKRNLEWNLTIEQFRILTKGNCYYCGIEPLQKYKHKKCNGDYIYNGIDRIDNTLGYNMDNCVSCCGRCNSMKEKLSKEEFLEHINNIMEYVGLKVTKKEDEELKEKIKTYEGRLGHLESCLPKMQHFNQKQRVRKEAFDYAVKIMKGNLDNEIFD